MKSAFLKHTLLILFSISYFQFAFGQKKWEPVFPADDPYFKNWGWQAGLGANYTLPTSGDVNKVYVSEDLTQINNYQFSPEGQLGAMVEGGAFYIVDNFILRYADAGLRFNYLRGKENYILNQENVNNGELAQSNGERSFEYMNASLRLNANNTIQISPYGFIQNTIGLNLDYYFLQNINSPADVPPGFVDHDALEFQLHYKLAYGFRLDLMHYLIIGIDTPILQFAPWNDGRAAFQMYESSYLPLTLSVQVLWLNKSNRPDCKKPTQINMNKKRKEAKMF